MEGERWPQGPPPGRGGKGPGGAGWCGAGAAVCSLSPRCVGPPASLCQRRSSSLPRFASERGYRPRPEETPRPKQQFVPRVKREAQHPHHSRRHSYSHSHQHRKERSVTCPTHTSISNEGQSPRHLYLNELVLWEKREEVSSSPSPLNPGILLPRTTPRNLQTMLPTRSQPSPKPIKVPSTLSEHSTRRGCSLAVSPLGDQTR